MGMSGSHPGQVREMEVVAEEYPPWYRAVSPGGEALTDRIGVHRLVGVQSRGGTLVNKHYRFHLFRRGRIVIACLILVALGQLAATASPLGKMPEDVAPDSCSLCQGVGTPVCVDFEDLTLAATYYVGDSFVDSGVVVAGRPFFWSNGTATPDGYARVGNAGLAGGSGLEMQVNNINLYFEFGGPLTGLSFRFGEYGGNLNIDVNGDFRNFENFADLNGLTIGGANVLVVNGHGQDMGWLRLDGVVHSFIVGGQELFIDDVCPETDCVDFEDLMPNTQYHVGDTFIDSGVSVNVNSFFWSNGTETSDGYAQVQHGGAAGGSGNEMQVNNVNLAFDFEWPLHGLSLDFGEYGGNLNMRVNDDFLNFQDFADIHGWTIGGAKVIVLGGHGNDMGRLFLFGTIHAFFIGGQELFIDNICPETCCVDFESLPDGTSYAVGDHFFDSCAHMTVRPFVWSNGSATSDGHALVGHGGLAGGSGKEMNLNNVNLEFDFGGPLQALRLVFGEYGGNLNIEVNSDFVNFDDFQDIDGMVIGGVTAHVVNGFGNDKGRLRLVGIIHNFSVGGQELWIDDICVDPLEEVTPTPTEPRETPTPTPTEPRETPTPTPTEPRETPTATPTEPRETPEPTVTYTPREPTPEGTPTEPYPYPTPATATPSPTPRTYLYLPLIYKSYAY